MSFDKGYVYESRDWVYFGYGEGWEGDRCSRCYDLLRRDLEPNNYCINCWKLEIFFSNCIDLEAVKKFLLELGLEDRSIHGKWLKKELSFPCGGFTSIPSSGHPDPSIKRDGVILIYTQSIVERNRKLKRILVGLKKRGLYKRDALSYRRGCLNFDELIGPWKDWYDLDKDHPRGKSFLNVKNPK